MLIINPPTCPRVRDRAVISDLTALCECADITIASQLGYTRTTSYQLSPRDFALFLP
jgi:hypothetical protein